ncbi:hypothetical protein SLA2020_160120 [Shorea laevis]
MDSSSSGKSSNRRNREKFLREVISPAIKGQTCPICLIILDDRRAAVLTVCAHAYCLDCIRKWSDFKRKCPLCNASFDSWFCKISLSSRRFLKQQLPALSEGKSGVERDHFTTANRRRIIQRTREELTSVSRRTRPLPWRRSFGRPGSVPSHVIAERKLQWRASVYHQRLQAVPSSAWNSSQQNASQNNYTKEKTVQKVEPWIRRELEAILGDPDPSIIVHVATSLFVASLEGKYNIASAQVGSGDDFLTPLRPFLQNWTEMFWHELRCFAESQFNMGTYDAVVKYERLD